MKSLYESLLDADIEDQLEDDIVKRVIWDFLNSRFWEWTSPIPEYEWVKPEVEYTIGKDSQGYYIDTKDIYRRRIACMYHRSNVGGVTDFASELKDNITRYNRCEKPAVSCPIFRWRKHEGGISLEGCQQWNSLEGMPDEIDLLVLSFGTGCFDPVDCGKHKIKKIFLYHHHNITLTGHPKVDEIAWSRNGGAPEPKVTFPCKNIHST